MLKQANRQYLKLWKMSYLECGQISLTTEGLSGQTVGRPWGGTPIIIPKTISREYLPTYLFVGALLLTKLPDHNAGVFANNLSYTNVYLLVYTALQGVSQKSAMK